MQLAGGAARCPPSKHIQCSTPWHSTTDCNGPTPAQRSSSRQGVPDTVCRVHTFSGVTEMARPAGGASQSAASKAHVVGSSHRRANHHGTKDKQPHFYM
mmetsp:Transcript_19918/g.48464  ORF Transcript_19918/g.48464 Transcript_19918/m.48464 type:complete len:99 (-) Transcript_19918:487-783(-)